MSDSKQQPLSKDSVETLQATVAEYQTSKEYSIIDEPQALSDVLVQNRITDVQIMEQAVKTNDHKSYYTAAHSLKGVCMNLHLPALVAICKAAEAAAKLVHGDEDKKLPNYSTLVDNLDPYITGIKSEFQRLEDYLPTLQAKADQEGGEGEEYEDGEGEGYDEEDGQQT